MANRRGADLFISLHFNAAQTDKDEVAGPETYCITPAGADSSNAHGESSEFGAAIGTGPTTANRFENKSLLLAYQMEKSLVRNLDGRSQRAARAVCGLARRGDACDFDRGRLHDESGRRQKYL